MREIHLVKLNDIHKHLKNIKTSLELIYQVNLSCDLEDVIVDFLFPTEDFLEKDKLALVLKKIVTENYDVPIIAVKQDNNYFILDGHHRSYISRKLMRQTVRVNVLKFPETMNYRNPSKHLLEEMPIKEVGLIDDPILYTWSQILTLMKYYEALYDISIYLKKEEILLIDLVPTQLQISIKNINSITEITVPILCVRYNEKYYILDGHARSLRAVHLGLKSIPSMVFYPNVNIEFGIVKTTKKMKLEKLESILIVDN